jgi:tetratricopeptide (TPR) repeat protein
MLGNNLGKPGEGLALVTAARAALARAGHRLDLQINFHYKHATVLITANRPQDALAALAEGKQLLLAAGAGTPGSPLTHRLATYEYGEGTVRAKSGDLPGSEAPLRRSIELWKQALGDDHPDVAWGYDTLAEVLRMLGKIDEAMAPYREAIRIREARLPGSSTLAQSLYSTGYTLLRAGRLDDARPMIERAIAILEARGARVELGSAQMVLGLLQVELEQYAEARATYATAIATLESTGSTADPNLPLTLWNRGDLATRQHQYELALPDYTRALELFLPIKGKDHAYVGNTYYARGRAHVMLQRHADAIADLDAAIAHPALPATVKAQARFLRGRALVESRRDRAGGLAAVRAARAELAAAGATAELAEIDAWLAAR